MANTLSPCPICHESLLPRAWEALVAPIVTMAEDPAGNFVVNVQHQAQKKIGVTLCGHCFHMKCYERWQEEENSLENNKTVCPMCQLPTAGFKQIYNLYSHPTSKTNGSTGLVRSTFDIALATSVNEACSTFRQKWDEQVSSFDLSVENWQTIPPACRPIVIALLTKLKLHHREMSIRHLFGLYTQLSHSGFRVFVDQFEVWANWLVLVQDQMDLRIRSAGDEEFEANNEVQSKRQKTDSDANSDPSCELQRAACEAVEQPLLDMGASVQASDRSSFVRHQALLNVTRSFDKIRSTETMTDTGNVDHQRKHEYNERVYEYLKAYCLVQQEILKGGSTDGAQDSPAEVDDEEDGESNGDATTDEQEGTENQLDDVQLPVQQGGENDRNASDEATAESDERENGEVLHPVVANVTLTSSSESSQEAVENGGHATDNAVLPQEDVGSEAES
jgi:Zinc finger, C3HC4 type (RING finger)